ncbi:HIT family protein [Bifidobacterium sp. UBA744]|uniref:HIT family protein n=1 Tax=Bifidobacterium sp. UBA744 TaxID=1946112 RepID=UPI0025C63840|nr:HIT family protein [Bifidobacterium sp. UBA744]
MSEHEPCSYCDEGALLDEFGIKIMDLPASKLVLFKEQSHPGRVIVASKFHVGEITELSQEDRAAFFEDVNRVAEAVHKLFNPDKVNYGAYGDTGRHLHFHLVPKYQSDPFEWGSTFAMNPNRTYLTAAEYDEMIAKYREALS